MMFCVVVIFIVAYELMPYTEVTVFVAEYVHISYIMTAQW
jgi:hypothetical protein